MKSLYELKEMLCRELDKIAEKGELSAGSLETLHKLTDTIKNIDKIEMMEEDGYSEDGGWMARGGYSRGGRAYDHEDSYRGRHYVRGHYSREGGKRHMLSQLEEMMDSAGTEKEREAIRRCMSQLENA